MKTAALSPSDLTSLNQAPSARIARPDDGWSASNVYKVFVIVVALLVIFVLYQMANKQQTVETVCGAALIMAGALFPSYLWAAGKAPGLPLFPTYALTFIWTYASPLLDDNPVVALFAPDAQLYGALTTFGFLILSTALWYVIVRKPVAPRRYCLSVYSVHGDWMFFAAATFGLIFTVASTGEWMTLDPGWYTMIRAVSLAAQALGCFVLSFRLGAGRLTYQWKTAFIILVVLSIVSALPGLLLINAMSLFGVVILGYILSSRRFPWVCCLLVTAIFALLHIGKSEMRERYWQEEEDAPAMQPTQYPALLVEWVNTSITILRKGNLNDEDEVSLLRRASLIHLLLYVQALSPERIPYVMGESYAVIPALLIPRILYPDKPRSHEGTYILNIHYEFQTREATDTTTIGWGFLNEAYANFGLVGVGMLACVIGPFYGWVSRMARRVPVLSFRALFAILVACYSFQTEFSASVYAAALFQSTATLVVLAIIAMKTRLIDPVSDTLLP